MKSDYNELIQEVKLLASTESKLSEILSAICHLLKRKVFHYDWVGIYILDSGNGVLSLGPYSGKPTEHTTIPVGKGVCGQVAESKEIKIVQDVTKEENYISCSIDVQSEIVVPILLNGNFIAEIDIDSHSSAPFTMDDEEFLTEICQILASKF